MNHIKVGDRVVRLDDNGSPTHFLGTVKDHLDSVAVSLVKWDSGETSMHNDAYLMNHQALKRMFKHGPKLTKKGVANA